MSQQTSDTQAGPNPEFRGRIAISVILLSFVGIAILLILAVGFASYIPEDDHEERLDLLRYVYASIIPLIATWMGTVLAFYFTSKVYESSAQTTTDLLKKTGIVTQLRTKDVTEFMIKNDGGSIVKLALKKPGKKDGAAETKISALFEAVFDKGYSRGFITNPDGSIFKIIHRSHVDRYLNSDAAHTKDNSLADLLADEDVEELLEGSIGFLAISANIAEAKTMMDGAENMKDIVVTTTGKRGEPVKGWLTDVELMKALETVTVS